MAKLLKLRRGTTTQHASFTGAEGEVTIDTTKDTAVVHDGSQAGGKPLAREDMSNVSSANILGRISNGDIVGTKLENSGVTAGQYGSSSAIPIVTVDAQGLVTAASTTSIDSTKIQNGSSEVSVANNGAITSNANHDFSAGIDVTGNITTTNNVEVGGDLHMTGHIEIPDSKQLRIGTGNDFTIQHHANYTHINETGSDNLYIDSNYIYLRDASAQNKLNTNNNGIAVTGNITVTGSVDGIDVAGQNTLMRTVVASTGTLNNGVVATTQAASDNSTKVATTEYVTTGIANAQAFPSGTKMLFQQTNAPTGWTKITSGVDNKSLRVVSGTAGSGGTNAFSNTFQSRAITANASDTTQGGNISVANTVAGGNVNISSVSTSGNVNSHTLSSNEMPNHSHNIRGNTNSGYHSTNQYGGCHVQGDRPYKNAGYRHTSYNGHDAGRTENNGGGGGHSHGFSGSSHNHNGSLSGNAHNHNASFTGSAHNHSISVTNLDLAVQYLDVIIASKD